MHLSFELKQGNKCHSHPQIVRNVYWFEVDEFLKTSGTCWEGVLTIVVHITLMFLQH